MFVAGPLTQCMSDLGTTMWVDPTEGLRFGVSCRCWGPRNRIVFRIPQIEQQSSCKSFSLFSAHCLLLGTSTPPLSHTTLRTLTTPYCYSSHLRPTRTIIMSTTAATIPTVNPSETAITSNAPSTHPAPSSTDAAPTTNVDDATYMMSTFSTLLEGDLYDDELNGM